MAAFNRMLDQLSAQLLAPHDEMHVNPGKHLGILFSAVGVYLNLAAANLLAAVLEDQHDVIRGAAAGAQ